ncbi:MAG TPA: hypothetical protein EYM38_04625 [Dehalococcoidia bacterium]|nr:hypothetical protein [Dehalococcoidia bacterium]
MRLKRSFETIYMSWHALVGYLALNKDAYDIARNQEPRSNSTGVGFIGLIWCLIWWIYLS